LYPQLSKACSRSPRGKMPRDIETWLLKQDAYTFHLPVRKHFPRNPYEVTNVIDVWECDLMDVQSLSKHNDKYKCVPLIDVFSKFLNIVPLRSKTSTAVASAFRSVHAQYSHRRPIWVRTDRDEEFLNRSFQYTLKKKGIQFHVCSDPNVKFAIIECSHRTIGDKLYKYMI
jgi:hypothetical protein